MKFWKRVNKNGPRHPSLGTRCWIWTGGKHSDGYGVLWTKKYQSAHRFSWELHFGSIPIGLCVCHKCDNPPCVRPSHLFLGTIGDNNRDAIQKGKMPQNRPGHPGHPGLKGEQSPTAKLSKSDIIKIHKLRQEGYSFQKIADLYPVSMQHIARICNGRSWKHITKPGDR